MVLLVTNLSVMLLALSLQQARLWTAWGKGRSKKWELPDNSWNRDVIRDLWHIWVMSVQPIWWGINFLASFAGGSLSFSVHGGGGLTSVKLNLRPCKKSQQKNQGLCDRRRGLCFPNPLYQVSVFLGHVTTQIWIKTEFESWINLN